MSRFKLLVFGLAILVVLGITAYAQDADNNTHLGTWMVTVTPPAASGRPAFNALITFSGGGAFIASTQNDHLIPNSGVQQGTWIRTITGSIDSTQLYFVYAPTGSAVATVKVRATYDFPDADDLTGQGQLAHCDLAGANCTGFPGFASITGKRVEVEESAIQKW
jgi:hypothetical protein